MSQEPADACSQVCPASTTKVDGGIRADTAGHARTVSIVDEKSNFGVLTSFQHSWQVGQVAVHAEDGMMQAPSYSGRCARNRFRANKALGAHIG